MAEGNFHGSTLIQFALACSTAEMLGLEHSSNKVLAFPSAFLAQTFPEKPTTRMAPDYQADVAI